MGNLEELSKQIEQGRGRRKSSETLLEIQSILDQVAIPKFHSLATKFENPTQ